MEAKQTHIIIRGCGAISPLGHTETSISKAYLAGKPAFGTLEHAGRQTPVAALPKEAEAQLQQLAASNAQYRQLDRSVLMAIYASRQAMEQAGWLKYGHTQYHDLAVNIGSSRGATGLFEQHFAAFHKSPDAQVASGVSPTTTLGNVSSWAAQAVNAGGAQISHSITCSTALMAVANAVAWIKAGMAKRFLAGGTEAPLTPFTIAQMKAVGIYSSLSDTVYPCQPYAIQKQNTFVLGEGAAVFALENIPEDKLQKGNVVVESIGFGFEPIKSKTGISVEGLNFQGSMRQALAQLSSEEQKIDLIITHTPGTATGDKAELAAIAAVFQNEQLPSITTNKWLIGHTLGASGALSIDYALHIFKQQFIQPPYPVCIDRTTSKAPVKRIMINAAGFGGNAASLVLRLF